MAAMALKLSCDTNDLTARVKRNRMQCKPSPSGVCLVFFPFFRKYFLFCPFSFLFAVWSWKLPFQGCLQHLEIEPIIFHGIALIFHGICNILVLELLMLHGILQREYIEGWFRVYLWLACSRFLV